MDNNIRSKCLEILLIPLFALMTQSCKNDGSKSIYIKTSDGTMYDVDIDTTNRVTATRVSTCNPRSLQNAEYYQVIDHDGDGIADTMVGESNYYPSTKIARPSDSTAKAEYSQKIYPIIKPILFKNNK
jgi:hypothetical protein